MYLHRVLIRNFRSIEAVDIKFLKGKNIIVGRNNCGKSNIIKAINIVLGEKNPNYCDLTENDFFNSTIVEEKAEEIGNENRAKKEIYIYCEIKRDENEDILSKISNCQGFYKYRDLVEISEKDILRDIENLFEIEVVKNRDIYMNPKNNPDVIKSEFNDVESFAYVFKAKLNENKDIEKEIRLLYKKKGKEEWSMCFSAPIRTEILLSAVIPSFRDPQTQLKINQWSWYGKLLKQLVTNHPKIADIKDTFVKIRKTADEIFSEIKSKINNGAFLVAFPETQLFFQFGIEELPEIHKNVVIYVDDGFKSLMEEKGSGIQSAIVIGLFGYYLNYINSNTSALLCVEEPELYLHPHACRAMNYVLDKFIEGNKNQVIITTHSPEFLKIIDADVNLCLVRKKKGKTTTKSINIGNYKDILIDSNQNEIFFADKVIVCEGYDNFIIKWVAEEFFGNKLNEKNVSIVSVGGKDNISRLVKLTIHLGIDTYILADFDYLLRDKDEEKAKKYNTKLHESLSNLDREFFRMRFGDDKCDKVRSKLDRIRNYIKSSYEDKFYTAKNIQEFSNDPKYNALINFLKELRNNGVCILSGEIEDLFRRASNFLSKNEKLDIEKIFKLSSILNDKNNGKKIRDMIDPSEIREFLESVLKN